MSSTLQIIGPAAIDLIEGLSLSSLDLLPPGGLALADSNPSASLSVTLASSVSLSASSAGGASVINGAGAITLGGTQAEINAALASLLFASTVAGAATLAITASDGTASATTVLALETIPDSAPAFIGAPASLGLTAGVATALGLTLADDPAVALAAFGAASEILSVTLEATSGVLLLDPSLYGGIGIAGDASGTIVLSATSTDLAMLNAALGAVTLDAASAGSVLYIASQTAGPLPITDTSGSLSVGVAGSIASNAESWTGHALAWQTGAAWSGGAAPGIGTSVTFGNGDTASGYGVAGGLDVAPTSVVDFEGDFGVGSLSLGTASALLLGDAALQIRNDVTISDAVLFVGADATLQAVGVTLGAAGALINLGAATLDGLFAEGFALLPGGATLNGPLAVASGGAVDFGGTLQADSAASTIGLTAISLFAGSTIDGAGTLIAGNFSQSENIAGPGTILALGPAPLEILAGSIGGGAHFVIDPGASLEFGAIAPLFGVFNATPVTVGSDATISFAPGASIGQDQGQYGSTLGEQGGVLVLDNPESFAGTIVGFLPGDRIYLPTLVSLSVFNVATTSFEVEGVVSTNTTQSEIITIHASLAAGMSPVVETDGLFNQEIGLRATTAALTLNDTAASAAAIDAVNGVATPIEGLGLLVPSDGSLGLVLTVTAAHGTIADGGAGTSSLTLSAGNALSLNAELAALSYTAPGSGTGDVLDFTGGTGLTGLTAAIAIDITAPATLDYTGGNGGQFDANAAWLTTIAPAGGDLAAFASHAGAPLLVTGPGVAGEVSIGGWYDFAGAFDFTGAIGGASAAPALEIGNTGFALFDANAVVTLGSALVIGDATGDGALGIAGTMFAFGNVTLGGVGSVAGSLLDVTGYLEQVQTLAIGGATAATLDVTGVAIAAATTLGGNGAGESGLIRASGTGRLGLGSLDIIAGTLSLSGSALAVTNGATVTGGVIDLAGQSLLTASLGGVDLAGGTLAIGPQAIASLSPGTLIIGSGGLLDLAGSLTGAAIDDAGLATIAGAAVVSGAISLDGTAALDLAGGTLDVGSLTIAAGATLVGDGLIGAVGSFGLIALDAAGLLEAAGGTLVLGASLQGNATIEAGAALEIAGSAAGGTLGFGGAGGELILNNVAAMQDGVTGFASGDAIDLIGVAPSLVSVSGGFVHVSQPSEEFALAGAAATVGSDGHGGALISVGGAMPCFARGAHLLTPGGYVPVECLRPGDRLATPDGAAMPIRWIGWRSIDLACDPAAALLAPVVIAPGAFGPGLPRRALTVSPLHAIFTGAGLVPAVLLVNGATIVRDPAAFAVSYYHVELERHAIVLAEGLPVETYRDNGNRDRFIAHLGIPGAPMAACAPLVLGGSALREARLSLHRRACALGHQIVHGPIVEALAASRPPIAPRRHGRRLIFDLPTPTDRLTLRCRAGMASDADPGSEDRRNLGICVGAVRADGRRLDHWEGDGWYPRAGRDRGVWSGAEASLRLPRRAGRISIEIIGSVPRWERDPAVLGFGTLASKAKGLRPLDPRWGRRPQTP